MKLKSLCMAMVVMGLSTTFAHAADGTLKFEGTITSSTCKIQGQDTAEITVPMAGVSVSDLQNTANGPDVGFDINMTGCESGTYYLVLNGVTPAGQQDVLELEAPDDEGTAKGVGIIITDIDNKKITLSNTLDYANDLKVVVNENGEGTFRLKAHYYAFNQGTLSPGAADAVANFTVVQQ